MNALKYIWINIQYKVEDIEITHFLRSQATVTFIPLKHFHREFRDSY